MRFLNQSRPWIGLLVLLLIGFLAGCGPQLTPEELPELPEVETGRYLAAVRDQIAGLQAAVVSDPLDANKTGRLGMGYLAYNIDEVAEVALRRAHLLQPKKFEWMYYHARALARTGRLAEAITVLQEAATRKTYAPAQSFLGQLYMQLGDLQTAKTILQALVDDDPSNVGARLALARVYLRSDEQQEAQSHLEHLLEQVGPSGSIYFALADVARRSGDNEKVVQHLAMFDKYRSVGVPTDDPMLSAVMAMDLSEKPLLSLARRLNQLGRTDEAMIVLHRALARNPHSDLTHAALVGAYGAMKQFEKVDEHYRLALASAPVTAPLLRNLGRARFYENRIPEAQQALEQALEINPHDASALTWLGLVHFRQNNIAAGIKFLTEALEENPREAMARHNLVNVLRKQGRHEEALVHMRELVIVEDRHSPRVWREMGQSYLILGQKSEARDALNKALGSAERLNDDAEAQQIAALLKGISR